jgi:large subunit ribosomal protein L6
MSRIGNQPIAIPAGVNVNIRGATVEVKGPQGALTQQLPPKVSIDVADGQVVVSRDDDEKQSRAFHGLTRALVANMVHGVSEGFIKVLEVHGVGYNVKIQGRKLVMELGFSHPYEFALPDGIEAEVRAPSNPAIFAIKGVDKQLVGQVAGILRKVRPVEPYKGKGIRYQGEQIRRKAGKTFASAG